MISTPSRCFNNSNHKRLINEMMTDLLNLFKPQKSTNFPNPKNYSISSKILYRNSIISYIVL